MGDNELQNKLNETLSPKKVGKRKRDPSMLTIPENKIVTHQKQRDRGADGAALKAIQTELAPRVDPIPHLKSKVSQDSSAPIDDAMRDARVDIMSDFFAGTISDFPDSSSSDGSDGTHDLIG